MYKNDLLFIIVILIKLHKSKSWLIKLHFLNFSLKLTFQMQDMYVK